MAKKRFYSMSERAMEKRDSGMLSNDMSACANMPQDVKYHAWPKDPSYASYNLDDTITGIDEQLRADGSGMRKHKSRTKY